MRVLVVAPDQDLNTIPEVRQIQRRHHMSVLHGVVTAAGREDDRTITVVVQER